MGKAADVSTSGTHHAKFCERRLETKQLELFNPNSNRRNLDTPIRACEFVGRHAADLLCGKWRWNLIERACHRPHSLANLIGAAIERLLIACRRTLPVVRVGGEPESNFAVVVFRGSREELRETRGPAKTHRQDSCRHWIKRAQMPDLPHPKSFTNCLHHVV